MTPPPDDMIDDKPRDSSEHAPDDAHPIPKVRTAMDASDVRALAQNPHDESGKLDVALDESFPGSDAPSGTQPGKGKDPPPSTGYDEHAEHARMAGGE